MKHFLCASAITAAGVLPGCEPENDPPTAKLEVTPITAEVPAEIRMRVTGQDPDGVEDITKYILTIGSENVTSDNPIDITRTFTNAGKVNISGQVTDSKNQSNKTPVKSLELVVGELINQSVSLINDNEIAYSATVKKIPSAKLTIKRNGSILIEEQITDNFQKTFKYNPDGITKGNYEFVAKSENLENKKSVTIPNYNPTADLSGIDINMEQGETISRTLDKSKISDKNPEDVASASYTNAKSLDGKTSASLSGNTLRINALPNQTGDYQVEIEFGSTSGGLEKSVLSGNININEDNRWVINPFKATNSNGVIWNTLTTKAQRENYVLEKLLEDWTSTIKYNPIPYLWDCTQVSTQTMINFHGFPNETGYSGFNLDSIYYYGGTLKDNGKYGIPVYFVTVDSPEGHHMNALLTGDISGGDITVFENWSLIEPQYDEIVKPGERYVPKTVTIRINAPPIKDGVQQYPIEILRFNVIDGVGNFEWINTDDPNLNIIRKR